MTAKSDAPVAKGIEALISSLRDQGVDAGKQEAEYILSDARKEVDMLLGQARKDADAILAEARKEADFIAEAGKQAFEMAQRNSLLELKMMLQHEFANRIRSTIGEVLNDQELLKQMILEVARSNAIDPNEPVEVLLPAKLVGLEELREKPEKLQEGSLMHFVAAEANNMLRDGVTFNVSEDNQHALVFRLRDKDVEVTLSDETISLILLNHLQPRFRALCEGVVG